MTNDPMGDAVRSGDLDARMQRLRRDYGHDIDRLIMIAAIYELGVHHIIDRCDADDATDDELTQLLVDLPCVAEMPVGRD